MTKADLVKQVLDALGGRVTKRECGVVVDAFLDAVKEALARGEGIELRGFRTFKVRHRTARTARNPRTGEAVEIAARDVPVFQPSRLLRSRVDRGSGVLAHTDVTLVGLKALGGGHRPRKQQLFTAGRGILCLIRELSR